MGNNALRYFNVLGTDHPLRYLNQPLHRRTDMALRHLRKDEALLLVTELRWYNKHPPGKSCAFSTNVVQSAVEDITFSLAFIVKTDKWRYAGRLY